MSNGPGFFAARFLFPAGKSLRLGSLLTALGLSALFVSGCASIGDVTRLDADLERRVERSLDDRLSAARAKDLARIEGLEAKLAARNEEYSNLAERIAQSESRLADLAEMLAQRFEELARRSAEMQRIAGRLDSEMDRLPVKTLNLLKTAIEAHTERQPRDSLGAARDGITHSPSQSAPPQEIVDTEWSDGSTAVEKPSQ